MAQSFRGAEDGVREGKWDPARPWKGIYRGYLVPGHKYLSRGRGKEEIVGKNPGY